MNYKNLEEAPFLSFIGALEALTDLPGRSGLHIHALDS